MKTTFFQSLRDKLMEIFHPWDYRKVAGCKCPEYHSACTDNACTDNACTDNACTDNACTDNACTDNACTNNACTDNTCTDNTCTDNAEEVDQKTLWLMENLLERLRNKDFKFELTESDLVQEDTMGDTPHSYQSLSESISMIVSQTDTDTESSELSSSEQTSEQSSSEPTTTTTTEDDLSDAANQCKIEERQLLLQRILIKVLIICVLALLTLLIAPKSRANDNQSSVALSVGVLYPNGLDLTAQYERSMTYHSAWAVELDGYLRWRKCPDCGKVCTVSFWEYYHSYHLGMVYKPCVYRSRNQHGRLRLGASLGYDDRKVLGGVLLGYEQTYCLRYGCEVFWTAKMDVHVLAKSWLRPGISIGLRLPI